MFDLREDSPESSKNSLKSNTYCIGKSQSSITHIFLYSYLHINCCVVVLFYLYIIKMIEVCSKQKTDNHISVKLDMATLGSLIKFSALSILTN